MRNWASRSTGMSRKTAADCTMLFRIALRLNCGTLDFLPISSWGKAHHNFWECGRTELRTCFFNSEKIQALRTCRSAKLQRNDVEGRCYHQGEVEYDQDRYYCRGEFCVPQTSCSRFGESLQIWN